MKIEKISSPKLLIYLIGLIAIIVMSTIVINAIKIFELPTIAYGVLVIIVGLILLVAHLLTLNSIEMHDNKMIIQGGDVEDGDGEFLLADLQEVYKMQQLVKSVSSGAGEINNKVTEYLMVFKMRDGKEIKINEALYKRKDKEKLAHYLYSKGFMITDRGMKKE